jgi:hypothetical protein
MAAALKVASKNKIGGKLPWRIRLSSFMVIFSALLLLFLPMRIQAEVNL